MKKITSEYSHTSMVIHDFNALHTFNIFFTLKCKKQRPFNNIKFQIYQTCFLLDFKNIHISIVFDTSSDYKTLERHLPFANKFSAIFAISAFLAFFKHSVGM